MRRTSLCTGLLAGALMIAAPGAHAASWSDQAVTDPSGATAASLGGIACASASDCLAVGRWDTGSAPIALAAGWSGSAWSLQTPATPTGVTSYELSATSCSGVRACTAVGTYDAGSGAQPHVQRWTGSWATQAAPAPVGATATRLAGVSCTTASTCTAVGYSTDNSGTSTLALRWDSGTWSIQSTPNPLGSSLSLLTGVACDASENCIAVGTSYGAGQEALVLSRSGGTGTWTLETVPAPSGSAATSLSGVACPGSGDCVAVGTSIDGTTFDSVPMAIEGGAGSWALTAAPALPRGAQGGWLSGVDCVAADDCTAVGATYDSGYALAPLGEDYDGSVWTAATPPLPGGALGGQLVAIDCTASLECSAAGQHIDSGGETRALTSLYE